MRTADARLLFLLTAALSVAILLSINPLTTGPRAAQLSSIFRFLVARQDYWGAAVGLLILCGAVFVPGQPWLRAVLSWIARHLLAVALLTCLATAAGAVLVYHRHPLSMDEYAQVFQSEVFASGHLAGKFPPALLNWLIPEGFQGYFLVVSPQTGAVASAYWPSFALLLTPFSALGIPWLLNPVVSACTVVATFRLGLRIFGDAEAAALAVLLLLASPVFFANGVSFYSMPAHLLANTVFALLLTQPTAVRAFAAGFVGSIALTLHNPVPHLLFAFPWIVWMAVQPRGLKPLVALLAGYLPLCIMLGLGWFWYLTQLRQDHLAVAAAAAAQSGSVERLGQVFALPDATVLLARAIGVAKVWIWATPCLLVLAAVGAWRHRADVLCRLLSASALCTFVGFFFVPADQGHGWGFRYFHTAWIALPILAAGAFAACSRDRQAAVPSADARSFVIACCLLSLTLGVGFRAWQIRDFVSGQLAQTPEDTVAGRRIEIVDAGFSFYGADLVQNDPFLRADLIRMVTRGHWEDERMMREYFPGMRRVHHDPYGSVWSGAAETGASQ